MKKTTTVDTPADGNRRLSSGKANAIRRRQTPEELRLLQTQSENITRLYCEALAGNGGTQGKECWN